jgi:hypothetical protein
LRPRPTKTSYDVEKLVEKAISLEKRLKKAEPGFQSEKITDINPHMMTETGGQTRTAHFHTNGKTIDTEDVKNTGAQSEKTNIENLSSSLNPHDGGGVEREVTSGGKTKEPTPLKKANPLAERREAAESGHAPQICGKCGGTTREGCRVHQGMEINACPEYRPLQ